MQSILCRLIPLLVLVAPGTAYAQIDYTLRVHVGDRTVHVGRPLFWDDQKMTMLRRDGQLVDFPVKQVKKATKESDSFEPYSFSEMQSQVMEEFGSGYQVTATGRYLIVHPRGEAPQWTSQFEDLSRSVSYYFGSRGIAVFEPVFPLVAIVFPDRETFEEHARETGADIDPSWVGFYSSKTNRIYLYDFKRGGQSQDDSLLHDTILHEAAHQSAYNVGVHNRWGGSPTWIVEGIGTMFEARGVYNASQYSQMPDRINREQLENYKRNFSSGLKKDTLLTLITDDKAFRRSGEKAYALAWTLTFMFSETQPAELGVYLQTTAARPPFRDYTAGQRYQDFVQAFGDDFEALNLRLVDFVQTLDKAIQ